MVRLQPRSTLCPYTTLFRSDDNAGNLRQVMNFPGTGPFRHVSRKDKEVWTMERNPDYWNKGLPYVDRLEVYHLPPFSDRKSTRLNSSHITNSYAVFCLKKKM